MNKKDPILLLTCFLLAGTCFAANFQSPQPLPAGAAVQNPAPANNGQPAATQNTAPLTLVPPKVASIKIFHSGRLESYNSASIGKDTAKVAYAGNIICFKITGALAFLRSKPADQAKVVLYVNGIEMSGITADWYSQVTTLQIQGNHLPALKDTEVINLQLVRNPASQGSWNYLYQNTGSFTKSYFDVRNASVGWEHMSPLDKGLEDNSLVIAFYNWWEFLAWSILYIVIIVLFIWLARRTDVLRAGKVGPFSLSSTQLLFWTSLVMGAFIYTLLLTDISMSFNTSVLFMMGISLGTTGAATVIDQNKINTQVAVPKPTQGFFKDLLTDGDSYSIQRVQSFAWNIILGLYFIMYTVKNKTMPEFSTTLLLLAGFSTSAYLAGKVPENTQTTVAAQQAQAQAVKDAQPPK